MNSGSSVPTASQHRLGIALVMLAGAFWSLGGVIVRLMESDNAWQILLYRSLFVCAFLWLVLVFRDRKRGSAMRSFRSAGWTGVVAGIGMSMAFVGFVFALVHTSVANAFFLLATQPFMIALLAWIVLREHLDRATLIAALVTLVGVVIMFREGLQIGTLMGNIAGLMSAVGFSIFTVALRFGRGVDMWPAMFYGGLFAALMSIGMLLYQNTSLTLSNTDIVWAAVLGITQIGLGTFAYIAGSKWVSAAELSLLAMTEIVLGPIWVWLVVDEVPARGTLIGGGIVLSALATLAIYRMTSKPPAQ